MFEKARASPEISMSSSAEVKMASSAQGCRRGSGGLRICGLQWLVAKDDFVFMALFEFMARIVGLCVLIGIIVYEETAEYTCVKEHGLSLYLYVAVAVRAPTIANLVALGLSSAQGPENSCGKETNFFVSLS